MALGNRHPTDTLTVEDWQERIDDYRARGLTEMLKYAITKHAQATKAKRYRKKKSNDGRISTRQG